MTTFKEIDVQELKTRWEKKPDLCVIDVREPSEWAECRIPGAILISKEEFAQKIHQPLDTPIYLHCKGGVRSKAAAQVLINLGYTEVYSIAGGILDWIVQGYAVDRA